jgi:hypothetical protein
MNDEVKGGQWSVVSRPLFVPLKLAARAQTRQTLNHKQLTTDH